jgi:hypothetical protein
MAKTEVYSWRLAPEKKRALERRARDQGQTVAQLLDRLTEELLASHADGDEAEQRRLHAAAAKFVGVISGDDPYRSENVSTLMQRSLRRKYGRR